MSLFSSRILYSESNSLRKFGFLTSISVSSSFLRTNFHSSSKLIGNGTRTPSLSASSSSSSLNSSFSILFHKEQKSTILNSILQKRLKEISTTTTSSSKSLSSSSLTTWSPLLYPFQQRFFSTSNDSKKKKKPLKKLSKKVKTGSIKTKSSIYPPDELVEEHPPEAYQTNLEETEEDRERFLKLKKKFAKGRIPRVLFDTALLVACYEDNFLNIQLALEGGANVNCRAPNTGSSPIEMATSGGHVRIVDFLLRAGANPNSHRSDGITPLAIAAEFGFLAIVELLIENNVDVNLVPAAAKWSPLYIACQNRHLAVADRLLKAGADPNYVSNFDYAPLHICAQEDIPDLAELLIQAKANVNLLIKDLTPLLVSVQSGATRVMRILLQNGADPNLNTPDNISALYIAAQYNYYLGTELLIQHGADVNYFVPTTGATALHMAAHQNALSVAKYLLVHGANPNILSDKGLSPLFIASQFGHNEIISHLIRAGANPNQINTDDGTSPLYIASQEGHTETVKLLLANNADVNHAKFNGDTPITTAVINNRVEIVPLLLKAGAHLMQHVQGRKLALELALDPKIKQMVEEYAKTHDE